VGCTIPSPSKPAQAKYAHKHDAHNLSAQVTASRKTVCKPSPGSIHEHIPEGQFCADRDVFCHAVDAKHIGGYVRVIRDDPR